MCIRLSEAILFQLCDPQNLLSSSFLFGLKMPTFTNQKNVLRTFKAATGNLDYAEKEKKERNQEETEVKDLEDQFNSFEESEEGEENRLEKEIELEGKKEEEKEAEIE